MKLTETFSLSFQSLRTNRLRTLLTILGVVVGIFSIIVITTILTMLQSTIENGVSFLSKNTFSIQKYPAIRMGNMQKYRNRPDITLEEFLKFEEMLKNAKFIGAEQGKGGAIIKYSSKETNPNIYIAGVTMGAFATHNVTIDEGRALIEADIEHNSNVCIIGKDVQEKIFPSESPLGKTVRVDNYPMVVIGTLEKQPSFFGQSEDNFIIIPITTAQKVFGKRKRSLNLTVQSYSDRDYDALMQQAIGYMRIVRNLQAGEENDFELFSNDVLMSQINDITGGVKIGAIAVSIIALLAAGVGIMNIMLVSVTERTKEIGIRKAIGARRSTILAQFLIEAITLCVIGGLIGILLGVGVGNLAGSQLNATAAIPYDWVAIGLGLCIFVGVLFGTYPAYKAANLDPIEALRYE